MASGKPDLPIHFRTGLRAVGIVAGRPVWPIFGGEESDDAAAQAAAKAAANAAAAKAAEDVTAAKGELGFPASTPLEQMTAEQREAYWKHQARKHEDRNKALTAEQAGLREKAQRMELLELEAMSDKDKAVAEARETAKAEARSELLPDLVQARFEAAAGSRLTSEQIAVILAPLDKAYFIDENGTVDTAKVTAYVDQVAPPATGTQRKGPSATAHGSGSGSGTPALSGRELYEQRHPKRSA